MTKLTTKFKDMEIYLVGGSVRDELLGRTPNDYDYVVVGETPQSMIDAGFVSVGKHFPVYLDEDGDEYALARTEKSTGNGYCEFVFNVENVTLEQDLERRDLTINAIAKNLKTGEIIDPMGGTSDLADGILRHCSDAFQEDPIRLMRLCRFSAMFPDFNIDNKTIELIKKMDSEGKFFDLDPQRVKREVHKTLLYKNSEMFFIVLHSLGLMSTAHRLLEDHVMLLSYDTIDLNCEDDGLTEDQIRMIKVSGLLSSVSIEYDEFMKFGNVFKKDHVKFAQRINENIHIISTVEMIDELTNEERLEYFYDYFVGTKMMNNTHYRLNKILLDKVFYFCHDVIELFDKHWLMYLEARKILASIDWDVIKKSRQGKNTIRDFKRNLIINKMKELV